MNTLIEMIRDAQSRLSDLDTARLDTEILMCHAMGINRSEIYTRTDNPVSVSDRQRFNRLIDKRTSHYPVAYLTGRREFWSREFFVNEHTLIPRPETEHLVEAALGLIPDDRPCNILDLGTGCGAIAITIASERPDCNLIATDHCQHALAVAKINASHHHTDNVIFIRCNWLTGFAQTVDFILSNPPYIKHNDPHLKTGEIQHEPQQALVAGDDGLDCIRKIICQAPGYLAENGWLLLEHGFEQGQQVRGLLETAGFNQVATRQDYAGLDRISLGRWCYE
jgi:release factor glutamine methyltransferase